MKAALRWIWWLLMLLAVSPSAFCRSFPSTPDLLQDVQERQGASLQGYVAAGCLPEASATTTVTIPPCRAFALETGDPPRLLGFEEETARLVALTQGPGRYWLIGRWSPGLTPPGWTCAPGQHYCVQAGATPPALPSGTVWLASLTVTSSGATTVEPLAPASPLAMQPLGGTVYANQHGLRCDGVSDNSAALEAAMAALPSTGGVIVLPASAANCRFSRTLQPTRPVRLLGAGMWTAGGASTPMTRLEYTGSGAAILLTGPGVQGSQLEAFSLTNSGTGTVGIDIDQAASMVVVREVGINTPAVAFSVAGVRIGATGGVHSTLLERIHVRESAPIGVLLNNTVSYSKILNSRILTHTTASVQVGDTSPARDASIVSSDISNSTGAPSILVMRASFVLITGCHIEQTAGGYGVSIPSTAESAENVRVLSSFINCLNNCLGPIHANMQGVDLVVEHNTLLNNSGGTAMALVDNPLTRTTLVKHNKLVDTLIPTTSSNLRTIVAHNFRTGALYGIVDGFGPERLCSSSSITANVGTGEDTLYTCTIPANQLFEDPMGIRLRTWGVTEANGNTKQIRVYIGGTKIFDTGAVVSTNDVWIIECLGLRSGAFAMRIACNGGYFADPMIGEFTGIVGTGWESAQNIVITGTATADGDITTRGLYVEVLR